MEREAAERRESGLLAAQSPLTPNIKHNRSFLTLPPSCDTIWHNAKVVFNSCVSAVDNRIVRVFLDSFFLVFSF